MGQILESKRQANIIAKLTQEGWLCVKLIKTSCNGIPDIMALKGGKTMFIEVKQPDGKLSELQKIRIQQLSDKGFNVKILTDYDTEFEY